MLFFAARGYSWRLLPLRCAAPISFVICFFALMLFSLNLIGARLLSHGRCVIYQTPRIIAFGNFLFAQPLGTLLVAINRVILVDPFPLIDFAALHRVVELVTAGNALRTNLDESGTFAGFVLRRYQGNLNILSAYRKKGRMRKKIFRGRERDRRRKTEREE